MRIDRSVRNMFSSKYNNVLVLCSTFPKLQRDAPRFTCGETIKKESKDVAGVRRSVAIELHSTTAL